MTVAKSPSMPFYGKQFYDDEAVWLSSLAHQGLYLALLWHQWANGSIPADVSLLARLVGQNDKEVRKLWESGVSAYFEPHSEDDSRLINRQLEQVRSEMVRLRQNRSNSGSKGGSKLQASCKANDIANCNPPYGEGDVDAIATDSGSKDSNADFSRIWGEYPRKRGREIALRCFRAQVKTPEDLAAIESAVQNYRQELDILGTAEQYILHGSTFFNLRWRDYADGAWTAPAPKGPQNGRPNPRRTDTNQAAPREGLASQFGARTITEFLRDNPELQKLQGAADGGSNDPLH